MSRFSVFFSKVLHQTPQLSLGKDAATGVLSLDFGSSFTRIKIGNKVVFDQPTCIAFHPGTGTVLAIGQTSYNMLGKSSDQVNVIFPVRRGKIADLLAAQQFLAAAIQPFLPQFKFLQPLVMRQVELAIPANSTLAQRSFFRQALSLAGYFRLQYEYKVAAIAHTIQTKQAQLLIDIGGQTTEVAICQGDQVLVKKTVSLGGDDFTNVLIQAIRSGHICEVGWQTAEKVKHEVGMVTLKTASATEGANLLTVVRGKDVVSNLPKTIQVKSSEVAKETTQLANELLLQVREVCDLAAAELLSQALEQGIYFTGNGSLLRNLPEFLSQGMSSTPILSKTPHLDVIKGLS